MKAMLATAFLLILVSMQAYAQTNQIMISKSDGSLISICTSEIDNISFSGNMSIDDAAKLEKIFGLIQNYPNPFNPSTTIDFEIAKPGMISVAVYNAAGQRIKTLISQKMEAGRHNIIWNGNDDNNALVASGTYFYQVKLNDQFIYKRMMLIK